jgi:hypothetical protein
MSTDSYFETVFRLIREVFSIDPRDTKYNDINDQFRILLQPLARTRKNSLSRKDDHLDKDEDDRHSSDKANSNHTTPLVTAATQGSSFAKITTTLGQSSASSSSEQTQKNSGSPSADDPQARENTQHDKTSPENGVPSGTMGVSSPAMFPGFQPRIPELPAQPTERPVTPSPQNVTIIGLQNSGTIYNSHFSMTINQ